MKDDIQTKIDIILCAIKVYSKHTPLFDDKKRQEEKRLNQLKKKHPEYFI